MEDLGRQLLQMQFGGKSKETPTPGDDLARKATKPARKQGYNTSENRLMVDTEKRLQVRSKPLYQTYRKKFTDLKHEFTGDEASQEKIREKMSEILSYIERRYGKEFYAEYRKLMNLGESFDEETYMKETEATVFLKYKELKNEIGKSPKTLPQKSLKDYPEMKMFYDLFNLYERKIRVQFYTFPDKVRWQRESALRELAKVKMNGENKYFESYMKEQREPTFQQLLALKQRMISQIEAIYKDFVLNQRKTFVVNYLTKSMSDNLSALTAEDMELFEDEPPIEGFTRFQTPYKEFEFNIMDYVRKDALSMFEPGTGPITKAGIERRKEAQKQYMLEQLHA